MGSQEPHTAQRSVFQLMYQAGPPPAAKNQKGCRISMFYVNADKESIEVTCGKACPMENVFDQDRNLDKILWSPSLFEKKRTPRKNNVKDSSKSLVDSINRSHR